MKLSSPMEVTELGMIIEVRPLQPWKEKAPIVSRLLGKEIPHKLVQPEKAETPIVVTLYGISIDDNCLRPANALSPIAFTLEGMEELLQPSIIVLVLVSIIALQLSRESYLLFFESTIIDDKLLQPEKTPLEMDVTFSGIVMVIKLSQLWNAPSPIEFTLWGIMVLQHPMINVLFAL